MSTIQHFDQWRVAETIPVVLPMCATRRPVRSIRFLASRETIQQAIDAAKAAFPAWRNTPPAKRAQVMFRFKQLLSRTKRVSRSGSAKNMGRRWKMRRASSSVGLRMSSTLIRGAEILEGRIQP